MRAWWTDARAILAILAVLGCFSLQGYVIISQPQAAGRDITSIPAWATAALMAIIGFYFGARGNGASDSHHDEPHSPPPPARPVPRARRRPPAPAPTAEPDG